METMGEDAWYINNGWCHSFAIGLARFLGPEAKIVNSTHHYRQGTFPGHHWVEFRGLHFDAETPFGVDDPRKMQYHIRLRAVADSSENVDPDDAVRAALGHDPVYHSRRARRS